MKILIRKTLLGFLFLMFALFWGFFFGVVGGEFLLSFSDEMVSPVEMITPLSMFFMMIVVSFIMQIIIHEAGHLIFGLLTKYRFSSFRVFNLFLVNEEGHIKIKYLKIAGTAGQCIMLPPELNEKRIPYIWYNLGGCLLNIITASLFVLISFFIDHLYVYTFLILLSAFGFMFALLNGFPLRMPLVNNDGQNILSLMRNPKAPRIFWNMLKANEYVLNGFRIKDFPEYFFVEPDINDFDNSIMASTTLLISGRLIDLHEFEKAKKYISDVLSIDSALIGLHRRLMICDLILCELLIKNDIETINQLLDKEQRAFMKEMKKYPSVIRTQYAYALLGLNDVEKANKYASQFEQCSKIYPYPIEIESERELLGIINARFETQGSH